MVLNGEMISLNLMKSLQKVMIKTMTKDAYLKLMLNILRSYTIYTVIFFFFPESINVKKWNKLACNLFNREKCVPHKKSVKQALYHELTLKKVYRTTKFNQKA